MSVAEEKKPRTCILSKKKYKEISEKLQGYLEEETLNKVLHDFCEVMRFNPEIGLYSQERLQEIYEKRRKEAEEKGTSLYVVSGLKQYYEKNKEKIRKQKLEAYHERKNNKIIMASPVICQ